MARRSMARRTMARRTMARRLMAWPVGSAGGDAGRFGGRAKKEISQAFGDRTEFSIHPMQFACYPEVKSSSTNMVQRCR